MTKNTTSAMRLQATHTAQGPLLDGWCWGAGADATLPLSVLRVREPRFRV
jgi:hypothetical protein